MESIFNFEYAKNNIYEKVRRFYEEKYICATYTTTTTTTTKTKMAYTPFYYKILLDDNKYKLVSHWVLTKTILKICQKNWRKFVI